MKTPKVYIPQENSRLNYLDAERFGRIIFITEENYSPIQSSRVNKKLMGLIQQTAQEFNPDTDFLLLTGSPILIGYMFHLIMAKKGFVNVLQWDNFTREYLLIQFNPTQEER